MGLATSQAFLVVGWLLCTSVAYAQSGVEGVWRTVDEATGSPKALVRIVERHGVLSGDVVQLFDLDPDWDGRCNYCRDHRKNQPVLGMVILSNARKNGNEYTGGEILDPENGNVYRCILRLTEGGNQLEVRGYIGIALFGRTQLWLRHK